MTALSCILQSTNSNLVNELGCLLLAGDCL